MKKTNSTSVESALDLHTAAGRPCAAFCDHDWIKQPDGKTELCWKCGAEKKRKEDKKPNDKVSDGGPRRRPARFWSGSMAAGRRWSTWRNDGCHIGTGKMKPRPASPDEWEAWAEIRKPNTEARQPAEKY